MNVNMDEMMVSNNNNSNIHNKTMNDNTIVTIDESPSSP